MGKTMRWLWILGCTLGFSAPAFSGTLYGLSSSAPGTVYMIDPSTGAATALVNLTGVSEASYVGLEFLNGVLYATDIYDVQTDVYMFGTIDLNTGAFTAINNQGGSANWHALAANPALNLFYSVDLDVWDSKPLVSVTPGGTISLIGPTYTDIRGLAYDSNHGILYGVDQANLYTIDPSTGAVTAVGSLGLGNYRVGLAYDPDSDTLFLNTGGGDNSLYRVDPSTGLATWIGPNGAVEGNGIDGLAYLETGVIPEPGTLACVLGGGALLALRLRRRTNEGRL